MMERKGTRFVVGVIAVLICFAVCGAVLPAAEAKDYRVNVATATTGGAYYPIGNAMAQIWSKNIEGVRASAQATAGTPQNVELMMDGDAHVAIAQNGISYYAYNGVETYKDVKGFPYKDMRGMMALYPNVMHWIVRKDAGIKTLYDLKGRRIIPGQVASATEVNSREMLAAYGMNYMMDKGETNLRADYLGYNEAADQMKNGQCEATHIAGGMPTAAVMDLTSSGLTEIISLEPDKIEEICKKYPWYFPFTIPAGTYPKQDNEVHTIALANILITDKGIDEDLIYKLTKAVYEYHDDMVIGHKATAYTTEDHAFGGMTVPLHKGSIRYFVERGIKVPEELIVDK